MNKLNIIATFAFIVFYTISFAQAARNKPVEKQRSPQDFPELIFATIPGAPKLTNPFLISGTEQPVITEGMGLAAPAFYDWNGDGLKDLLVGEFCSGVEKGKTVGNFIRVYINEGTAGHPVFSGKWDYARLPFEWPGNGTPYSVDQFCCIGFTPQFTDLNNDKELDMVTGSYYGEVTWFPAGNKGFKPGEIVEEDTAVMGAPRHEPNETLKRKAHQYYWLYSSASFGDFTGDGKPDMVTGGLMALRMSKNTGTISDPKFGQRELLHDVNGNPLKVYELTKEDLKQYEQLAVLGYKPPVSGDGKLSPYVVDWDQDGVLDLLVTNSYSHAGLSVVDFFKGVQTPEGMRFQQSIPLFTANGLGKAFPGSSPHIFVTDWNGDGINDLLIGISILTVSGKFNFELSWTWQADEGVIKDPAYIASLMTDGEQLSRWKASVKLPEGINWKEYTTIRHQGYVYVMLGK